MGGKRKDKPEAEESLETEFERRVARLTEIAEEAEFESGSLVGDIRDALVDIFKNRPKPWSQLSEAEQRDLHKGLEQSAKMVLKKLVLVIAEEDDVSVQAVLKGYSVKGDAFKLTVEAKGDADTALELFKMDGHDVVLIRADSKRFHGQKRDGEVQPDQPALEFEGDGKPQGGAGPEGDADLADEGTEAITRTGDKMEVPGHGECEVEVNLKTGMVEATPLGGGALNRVDVREATPDELAAERDRIADDIDETTEAKPSADVEGAETPSPQG